jgi:uncharacterized alpha/beta hydrolase family protein
MLLGTFFTLVILPSMYLALASIHGAEIEEQETEKEKEKEKEKKAEPIIAI